MKNTETKLEEKFSKLKVFALILTIVLVILLAALLLLIHLHI